MKQYDAVVIGGGILGCMLARNLRRWEISTILLEKEADVCMGITRANSAIVYPGYDNKPGSRKAAMTVRGNANMDRMIHREVEDIGNIEFLVPHRQSFIVESSAGTA